MQNKLDFVDLDKRTTVQPMLLIELDSDANFAF